MKIYYMLFWNLEKWIPWLPGLRWNCPTQICVQVLDSRIFFEKSTCFWPNISASVSVPYPCPSAETQNGPRQMGLSETVKQKGKKHLLFYSQRTLKFNMMHHIYHLLLLNEKRISDDLVWRALLESLKEAKLLFFHLYFLILSISMSFC